MFVKKKKNEHQPETRPPTANKVRHEQISAGT